MGKVMVFSEEKGLYLVEVEKVSLTVMYELIDCDTVDVIRLPKNIDLWVDDEGLLKSRNIVNMISFEPDEEPLCLAGNLLFTSFDDEGNSIVLNTQQVEWLKGNLKITPYGVVR